MARRKNPSDAVWKALPWIIGGIGAYFVYREFSKAGAAVSAGYTATVNAATPEPKQIAITPSLATGIASGDPTALAQVDQSYTSQANVKGFLTNLWNEL